MTETTTPLPITARLDQRLAQLRSEFAAGQKMLADMDTKAGDLRSTLLRISGAIQVLEEMIAMYPKDEDVSTP